MNRQRHDSARRLRRVTGRARRTYYDSAFRFDDEFPRPRYLYATPRLSHAMLTIARALFAAAIKYAQNAISYLRHLMLLGMLRCNGLA